jgi:hypothetical protein
MFDALKSKAQGLTRAASIATGFYCAAKYAVQRVEDAKHDAAMERDARDQFALSLFYTNMDELMFFIQIIQKI